MVQKNQLLLRFLRVRIVVNGTEIYSLVKNKPIEISIPTNPAKIVVTDGFHITKPIEIAYKHRQTNCFKIVCGIDNDQLIFGALICLLIYTVGATSGLWLLQLIALSPILYFLFLYYIKKKRVYTDTARVNAGSATVSISLSIPICRMVVSPSEFGLYIGLNFAPYTISSQV